MAKIFIEQLMSFLTPYWQEIVQFNFNILNPLFWLGGLILFLLCLQFWKLKKSFSCTVIILVALLLITFIEKIATAKFGTLGLELDAFIVRLIGFFIIGIILFYYVFIRE
jgi:peptidoglycan/LPS O-acetylase OafA/YrhL